MERDIKSIVVLLLTQAMINLGEIRDPVHQSTRVFLDKGKVFVDLLEVLQEKTRGNLTPAEEEYLDQVVHNVREVYRRKAREE